MEIVKLKNVVHDEINKLIFKFVGFKHPVAEMFKKHMDDHLRTVRNPEYTAKDAAHFFGYGKMGAYSHSFQNILEIETTEKSKGKERRIYETSTVVKIRVIKQQFLLNAYICGQ